MTLAEVVNVGTALKVAAVRVIVAPLFNKRLLVAAVTVPLYKYKFEPTINGLEIVRVPVNVRLIVRFCKVRVVADV